MKNKFNALAFIIITAALSACQAPSTPEQIAKRQRYETIGGKLISMGVNRNVLTKEEAADIQELGGIILATKASPVQPITSSK